MRTLVTGAAGFLGGHIVTDLKQAGHDVTPIDKTDHNLLRDDTVPWLAALLTEIRADYCVHLAAKVGRLFGEEDPIRTINDNTGMTCQVARACAEAGTKLAYASTSEVYGDMGDMEAAEYGGWRLPHNAYGLSKRHGEEFAQLYAPDGLVLMRFSMPYGPGHPPGRGRAAITNILHQAHHRQPIPVHRGAERSWCWVGDTARAVRLILEGDHAGAWNVGRDDAAVPMRGVAELACQLTGAPVDLIEDVDPPDRQTVVKRLSTLRLRNIGWEPRIGLGDGMLRLLEYVRTFGPVGEPLAEAAA